MECTITHSGISQNNNVGVESTAPGLRTRHSPCESSVRDGTELKASHAGQVLYCQAVCWPHQQGTSKLLRGGRTQLARGVLRPCFLGWKRAGLGGRGVRGLHFPSEHLLLSRKGMLSPGQGQNLAWFRVTILWKGMPRKEAN